MEKFGYEKREILVDRVLYLKHNLICNMNQPVAESEAFIRRFRNGE